MLLTCISVWPSQISELLCLRLLILNIGIILAAIIVLIIYYVPALFYTFTYIIATNIFIIFLFC